MQEILFYKNPTLLNKEQHQNLVLVQKERQYQFAQQTNSIPLVVSEFSSCASNYPIVFVKAGEAFMPAALLGVNDKENLFVDEQGGWDAEYIPAYVRRYPFILAEMSEEGEEFNVCFDESTELLTQAPDGIKLFDKEGEPAEYLETVLNFLQEYQGQINTTQTIMSELKELDVMVERVMQVQRPSGEILVVNGFYVVDVDKIHALDDDKIVNLFRSGLLEVIQTHWISLIQVNRLAALFEKKYPEVSENDQSPGLVS